MWNSLRVVGQGRVILEGWTGGRAVGRAPAAKREQTCVAASTCVIIGGGGKECSRYGIRQGTLPYAPLLPTTAHGLRCVHTPHATLGWLRKDAWKGAGRRAEGCLFPHAGDLDLRTYVCCTMDLFHESLGCTYRRRTGCAHAGITLHCALSMRLPGSVRGKYHHGLPLVMIANCTAPLHPAYLNDLRGLTNWWFGYDTSDEGVAPEERAAGGAAHAASHPACLHARTVVVYW